MDLSTSLEFVKGVGPKTFEQLELAGLRTAGDLISFFPRTYEDFSVVTSIASIRPGKVSLSGYFEAIRSKQVRRGMTVTEATLVDSTGKVAVVWFNQSYRQAQLKKSGKFLVSGEFSLQRGRYQVVNPSTEAVSSERVNSGRIVPVYRQVAGLKTTVVRKLLLELRPLILTLDETLPAELLQKEKLMSYAEAVETLHFPATMDDLERAKERLGFEELLALMLASSRNRADNDALEGQPIQFQIADAKSFVDNLPFKLTNAQRVSAWEAIQNLSAGTPMNRLLQGDVGAGKTVVAGLVAFIAHKAGFQTAFMAPTELLAVQHAETLTKLLEPFEVSVGLFTGSVRPKARVELYRQLSIGNVHVAVGTHALLQDKVKFARLGFVVIDEQHRFGVDQRQKLLAKSEKMPHLLAMTATPIPRSLQLTVYGELDISILNEKPKDRLPIKTEIVSPNSRAQMYQKIENEIVNGRQVYVVCPRIDDRGDEVKSVQAEVKRLKQSVFKSHRIGLLHGKLASNVKNEVMQSFATGDLDILVSTTVVEVGVDVPNATVMVIEGADSFGLAQLHQLRGRVGRATWQSYCYLVASSSQAPSRRLRELEKSNDGFYLAERDLELRGPGEIYGRMQHGDLNLSFARLTDTKLLKRVTDATKVFEKNGLDLIQYKQLSEAVEKYRRLTTLN